MSLLVTHDTMTLIEKQNKFLGSNFLCGCHLVRYGTVRYGTEPRAVPCGMMLIPCIPLLY